MRLSELTTLRIGGEITRVVEARSEDELISAVRTADEAGEPLLVLGGGSNLVASDKPFHGTVVRTLSPADSPVRAFVHDGAAPEVPDACCGGISLTYFAGEVWDEVVQYAIALEAWGIEALSGIPGSVGATPIQNVGAYGQDVSATIERVVTWDRVDRQRKTFSASDLQFAYRNSILKSTPMPAAPDREGTSMGATGRYVVLSVSFHHAQGSMSAPIQYAELASRLGVQVGERAPMSEVREAVLAIRGSKGMVLNPADHDTWSAGSFFTNPIIPAEQAQRLPEEAPRFPAGEGMVKTSAAWLISAAGFERGFSLQHESGDPVRASLSTKHSLALTNRGTARSQDIVDLAQRVQRQVRERFDITLVPEPVRLGVNI